MLAMGANDDEGSLTLNGALRFFASKLAPTVGSDRRRAIVDDGKAVGRNRR